MKKRIRTTALVCLGGLLITACGNGATEREQGAAEFPNKPVTLSVPFPAGGPTDTEARVVAKAAEKELDQSIVIKNVEGAGGSVLWNQVPGMATDGHELVMYNLPHIVSIPLVRDVDFDTESFAFIVNQSTDPTAFYVRKDSPIKSLDDLIDKAKQKPDGVTIGMAGKWLAHHLAVIAIEEQAGIKLKDQPFDGSDPEIQATLGGHVDVASGNVSDVVRSGKEKFRVLAVAGEERSEFLPDAPTFKEQGNDILMSSDRGLAAPSGIDKERLKVLRDAFGKAIKSPDVQEELRKVGAQPLIKVGDEIKPLVQQRGVQVKPLLDD